MIITCTAQKQKGGRVFELELTDPKVTLPTGNRATTFKAMTWNPKAGTTLTAEQAKAWLSFVQGNCSKELTYAVKES
jgi:hypothetical protein